MKTVLSIWDAPGPSTTRSSRNGGDVSATTTFVALDLRQDHYDDIPDASWPSGNLLCGTGTPRREGCPSVGMVIQQLSAVADQVFHLEDVILAVAESCTDAHIPRVLLLGQRYGQHRQHSQE